MAKKFLNDIDMDQNEILNMRVQNLSSAPSNPKEGQLYYNSIDKLTYQYNGTSWIPLIVSNSDIPVGSIYEFGGSVTPTNYLICDGSAISRTEYSELFNVIGTSYGTGDGSTTFNLPDLRSRVPVGLDSRDTDFDTLGEIGGEKTHILTIDEMPSHNHTWAGGLPEGQNVLDYPRRATGKEYNSFTNGINNTGGSQAHNNVQPYQVVNYIIKAKSANSNSMLRKVYNACDLTLTFSETGEVTPQEFVNAWFGDETHAVSDLKPIIEDIFYNNAILMMGTQPIVCPCATDFRGTSSSAPFGVAMLKFGWFQPTENMIHFLYFTFNATRNRLTVCRDWDLTYSHELTTDNDYRALSLAGAKALKDLIDDLQAQITALATKVDTQELDINGTKVLYDDGN